MRLEKFKSQVSDLKEETMSNSEELSGDEGDLILDQMIERTRKDVKAFKEAQKSSSKEVSLIDLSVDVDISCMCAALNILYQNLHAMEHIFNPINYRKKVSNADQYHEMKTHYWNFKRQFMTGLGVLEAVLLHPRKEDDE